MGTYNKMNTLYLSIVYSYDKLLLSVNGYIEVKNEVTSQNA